MNAFKNIIRWWLSVTFILLAVLLPSLFVSATSIYRPGTPPKLNLIVKNVKVDSESITAEGKNYYIEPGSYAVAVIEKEGPGIKVERRSHFSVEINQKIEHYPSISLSSESSSVTICRTGHYSDCQQQKERFKGLGGLEIYRTDEIYNEFYDYYVTTHSILSLPDWEITGEIIGDRENKDKIVAKLTIQGNFNFTPPSDEWIAAGESQGEGLTFPQRTLYILLGILSVITAFLAWKIIRKKGGLFKNKIFLLALLITGACLLALFLIMIFIMKV